MICTVPRYIFLLHVLVRKHLICHENRALNTRTMLICGIFFGWLQGRAKRFLGENVTGPVLRALFGALLLSFYVYTLRSFKIFDRALASAPFL